MGFKGRFLTYLSSNSKLVLLRALNRARASGLESEGNLENGWLHKCKNSSLFKNKGSPLVGENYRFITIASLFLKLLLRLILLRVSEFAEVSNILGDF